MNVSLTTELEKWVQSKVESGMYTGASEVIRSRTAATQRTGCP
jgi:antitoxin ParD1/3/4